MTVDIVVLSKNWLSYMFIPHSSKRTQQQVKLTILVGVKPQEESSLTNIGMQ